jgi:hypothetical protein
VFNIILSLLIYLSIPSNIVPLNLYSNVIPRKIPKIPIFERITIFLQTKNSKEWQINLERTLLKPNPFIEHLFLGDQSQSMQPTPEALAANQRVANETQLLSNLQPTPVSDFGTFDFDLDFDLDTGLDFDLETLMGQQEPNMTVNELQQQEVNQLEQQEWQQQQQQQPMEVDAPGQEQHQHLQQLDQHQNYFNVGNLNNQQLEDTYPQYQQQHQQIQSVNQHELIQQQQERAVSGI